MSLYRVARSFLLVRCLGIVATMFLANFALAQSTELPEPIVEQLSLAQIPQSAVGIVVQLVDAAEPVLAFNAQNAMSPASTMKVLTTLAALDILGPAFTWRTQFFIDGTLEGDILHGNLIVKGYGDPAITLEDFWLILRNLRQRGLREIQGDLILDRSYFDVPDIDPGQFDDQPARPYNVGPDALLLNNKSIRLQFIPDAEQDKVKVLADPHPPQVEISDSLTLDTESVCKDWVDKLGNDIFYFDAFVSVTFSGSYPASCGEKTHYISVLTPQQYFYGVFAQMWKELGGTLTGQYHEQALTPTAKLFAEYESKPLSQIVRDTNKFSNNIMARQLFLTLGAATRGEPATIRKSQDTIAEWLSKKGLAFPELVLENGSGLSRLERISPEHLAQLLLTAYHSPLMPEFLSSLPLLGVDGTLKEKLNGSDAAGRAHIKTGSLEGVKAIAGYVIDNKGRTVVIVCIINDANAANAQSVHDALIQWVYQRQ